MNHQRLPVRVLPLLALSFAVTPPLHTAQAQEAESIEEIRSMLERHVESLRHQFDVLNRRIDDVMFFHRVGDIADIDIVSFTGPPPRYQPNATAQGAGNPLRVRAYVFIPRDLDRGKKQPLIVFPHGGVHSNFGTGSANVLREMLQQGYTLVATEYRGSSVYGGVFYRTIDYCGLEI